MNPFKTLLVASPLVFALPGLGAPAQDALAQDAPSQDPGGSGQELTLRLYEPKNLSALELYSTASDLLSRMVVVVHEDGNGQSVHESLQLMGGRIVVFETEKGHERIAASLEVLDKAPKEMASQAPKRRYVSMEYRPKHASLAALQQVLSSHWREIATPQEQFENVQVIDDTGALILRDEQDRVDEMLALLERVDQPAKQMLLVAYLVTAEDLGDRGLPLPQDMTKDLAPLVQGQKLVGIAQSVVRTELGHGNETLISLDGVTGNGYEFRFTSSSFDPQGGSMGLDTCTLTRQGRVAFQTQTSIQLDDYVVLGATGANPVYLVLKAELQ